MNMFTPKPFHCYLPDEKRIPVHEIKASISYPCSSQTLQSAEEGVAAEALGKTEVWSAVVRQLCRKVLIDSM